MFCIPPSLPLFRLFIQGVRRLGAAAVDMCHVALGIVEAYWEYRLKPWDMAAGVLVMLLSDEIFADFSSG